MDKHGLLYYQPKQCTINKGNPPNYHTLCINFDPPPKWVGPILMHPLISYTFLSVGYPKTSSSYCASSPFVSIFVVHKAGPPGGIRWCDTQTWKQQKVKPLPVRFLTPLNYYRGYKLTGAKVGKQRTCFWVAWIVFHKTHATRRTLTGFNRICFSRALTWAMTHPPAFMIFWTRVSYMRLVDLSIKIQDLNKTTQRNNQCHVKIWKIAPN